MSRYSTTGIIQDLNEKRRKSTTIISTIPISVTDIYIQTTSVERLDKLANKFYDDSTLWWIIASANALGKGTIVVPQDTILRIPAKSNINQIINSINLR
jgi:hypothetical protein